MGAKCLNLKQENFPTKIIILTTDSSFILRSVPHSFRALESLVALSAHKYFPQKDPLTYFIISYISKKAGFHLKLTDDRTYRAALRNAETEVLTLRLEPTSYRNLFSLSLKDTGIMSFDSILTNLFTKIADIEENVGSLLQAYDHFLNFSKYFSSYYSYPSFQLSMTVLLITTISDSNQNAKAYDISQKFPFIEFNSENLGPEGLEAVRFWNDLVYYLEKVLPKINEIGKDFKRMEKVIKSEIETYDKTREMNLNLLIENSQKISQYFEIGLPLERKIKNIFEEIDETFCNISKPQGKKVIQEMTEILKISKTHTACSAIGIFGVRGRIR